MWTRRQAVIITLGHDHHLTSVETGCGMTMVARQVLILGSLGAERTNQGGLEELGMKRRWRAKPNLNTRAPVEVHEGNPSEVPLQGKEVSYASFEKNELQQRDGTRYQRRLASTIVTPTAVEHTMECNITIRTKGVANILSFSPLQEQETDDTEQMIGALNYMDTVDQQTA
ncbi:unnamed protein product [Eruca vesicaria subsp. sativa]|uniref:Uncharacterized protein n=1 Tax=Eruca vesicaria subsp. sativa TaxID=29727 RepID=A0ABC8KKF1_ERUVS|nr:unnamed protein product [Eruca vesicaria subsp. sativa]